MTSALFADDWETPAPHGPLRPEVVIAMKAMMKRINETATPVASELTVAEFEESRAATQQEVVVPDPPNEEAQAAIEKHIVSSNGSRVAE